ncbi:RagB/SusD family nutrient uptake outer membrane protein [Flammeovirga sp. OC4]|uniref:RagB/SusD family nutrient uptake outer membrane protein n=1 Tax=Flammeovirga sp. OC4 TaxID=1382345 RepID=UPI0005C77EAD|nr:RagB/SusD family nutrient uptake outer membrane protein [Flammeovirga sp. OC4]
MRKDTLLYYKTLLFLFFSLGIISCDSFLEEDPKGFVLESDIPNTYEGAVSLVAAPYENWVSRSNLYGRWFLMWETGTDDQSTRDNLARPMDTYLLHKANPDEPFYYTGIWAPLWKGVADCNNSIEVIHQMQTLEEELVQLLKEEDEKDPPNYDGLTEEQIQILEEKRIFKLLLKVEGMVTDTEKKEIIAELKVLRALYYYHLVRMFGDVPKITLPMNQFSALETVDRADVMEVYEDIIVRDLTEAIEYLPETYSSAYKGRFTRTSAFVILADVYLTMAGWRYTSNGQLLRGEHKYYSLAMAAADSVLQNRAGYEIFTQSETYDNPFEQPWRQFFSKESLVEFGNLSGFGNGANGEGLIVTSEAMMNQTVNFWGVNLKSFHGGGAGTFIPTPDLYKSFEEGDLRREFSMLTKGVDASGDSCYNIPLFHKLLDPVIYKGQPGFQRADGNINIILYRVADAMLIYAEASNEVNGPTIKAYDQVNQLRRRAGLADLPTGMTKDEFRKQIWKERRAEFNAEGKRKFDLVRTNRLKQLADATDFYYSSSDNPEWKASSPKEDMQVTYIPLPYPIHEYIWPIPRPEMALHPNWKQNYGY